MSQREIYNFLKENKERDYYLKELVGELNLSKTSISANLRKLVKSGLVDRDYIFDFKTPKYKVRL